MQSQFNEHGWSSPRQVETTGSRPPDNMPHIPRCLSLERPASPTLNEEQWETKKSRNCNSSGGTHDLMAVDNESIGNIIELTGTGTGRRNDMHYDGESDKNGVKETYASKVMGHRNSGGAGLQPKGFVEDDVTIMEEDSILNRGLLIPSICFSDRGMCPKSKETDKEHNQEVGVENLVPAVPTETNLYGPWMMTVNRRRRGAGVARMEELRNSPKNVSLGSRFIALDTTKVQEEERETVREEDDVKEDVAVYRMGKEVTRNDAYLASNPGKKTKAQKKVVAKPTIVPLVEGSTPTVVEHTPRINNGSHSAIRILEEGKTSKNSTRGKLKVANTLNKGVKIKKCSDNNAVVSNVVEWVKSAQAQVDLIATTPVGESDGRMEHRQNSNVPITIPDDDGIGNESSFGDRSDLEIDPTGEDGREW
ncbi:hypothetical protein V6N12_042566 [Hibiscus sabdariffa]|uniref:Uncharacterized protein n=1 Tax=Hibiscus sabdariffa TaxID=183260 RepID=A0ABR2EGP8_9ROSI